MKWFCDTQFGGIPHQGKSQETLKFFYGSPFEKIYLTKITIQKNWNAEKEKEHEFVIRVYPKNSNEGLYVFFNQAVPEVIEITVSSDDQGIQILLNTISEILSKINPSASDDNLCFIDAISLYCENRFKNPNRCSSFPAIENKESRLLLI